jgi:hypothetical protein
LARESHGVAEFDCTELSTTENGAIMSSPKVLRSLTAAAVICSPLAAPASGRAAECSARIQPAATLLVPYFAVDLQDPAGLTTLVAVGNADDAAALARVTMWTDWGLPTLAFDVALGPDAVQTINLRDVFAGTLPTTSPPAAGDGFADCTTPLAKPPLGADELARLRARHSGAPDPVDGECYGSTRSGPGVAAGFLTVDSARACAPAGTYPNTGGYFAVGSGVADQDNLLYGDFFLVDPGENFAQGNTVVHLVADPTAHTDRTFYGDFGFGTLDARAPLGTRHRTRFVSGGGFSGATQLLVFAQPSADPTFNGGITCGQRTAFVDSCQFLDFTLRPESGTPATTRTVDPVTELTRLYSVSASADADVQTSAPFGIVDIENKVLVACMFIAIGEEPLGAWVMPLQRATGRYSVGLEAIRVEPDCTG